MFGIREPQNDLLKKYVEYFHYFCGAAVPERRLILFPNIGSAITFYFNSRFYEQDPQTFISEESPGTIGLVLHLNRIEPVEIIDRGRQDRITAVFPPLGINHFTSATTEELLSNQNPTNIDLASKDHRYHPLLHLLKNITTLEERIAAIESFLASVFTPPHDELIVRLIQQFDPAEKLTSIAGKAATTTKTMDRLFKKHIGITPVEYKSILQFRRSLSSKLTDKNLSLTDLAYESNYHDLPYMMKVYRKFTRQPARAFFDRLQSSPDGKYLYQLY